MFPLEFPRDRLAGARRGDWVLDPFCGRGTTNYAARLLGLPSVGVDVSPIAAAIAAAKLVSVTAAEVTHVAEQALRETDPPVPEGPFWRLAFHQETLRDLCRVRARLLARCSSQAEVALRALVLGILHGPRNKRAPSYLSNQMPRTYATKPEPAVAFWRRHAMRPPQVDVLDLVARRAEYVFADVPEPVDSTIVAGDSRVVDLTQAGGPFSWVVTSPPYPGMRTYQPDQWLRSWFIGGPADVDYSQAGQLGATVIGGDFTSELAAVWDNVACACRPGARLIMRFGALPSIPADPEAIARESLLRSRAPWRVDEVADAGPATSGRRQASQFHKTPSPPRREVDVTATLAA